MRVQLWLNCFERKNIAFFFPEEKNFMIYMTGILPNLSPKNTGTQHAAYITYGQETLFFHCIMAIEMVSFVLTITCMCDQVITQVHYLLTT
jgi:hypothetical protein